MAGSRRLTVVPHELEPPDHLADGEETEALGKDNTRGRELGVADAQAAALGGLHGLGHGLNEGTGPADGLPGGLVDGLERGNGAASR